MYEVLTYTRPHEYCSRLFFFFFLWFSGTYFDFHGNSYYLNRVSIKNINYFHFYYFPLIAKKKFIYGSSYSPCTLSVFELESNSNFPLICFFYHFFTVSFTFIYLGEYDRHRSSTSISVVSRRHLLCFSFHAKTLCAQIV